MAALLARLERHGLSLRKLAEATGIPFGTLAHQEVVWVAGLHEVRGPAARAGGDPRSGGDRAVARGARAVDGCLKARDSGGLRGGDDPRRGGHRHPDYGLCA